MTKIWHIYCADTLQSSIHDYKILSWEIWEMKSVLMTTELMRTTFLASVRICWQDCYTHEKYIQLHIQGMGLALWSRIDCSTGYKPNLWCRPLGSDWQHQAYAWKLVRNTETQLLQIHYLRNCFPPPPPRFLSDSSAHKVWKYFHMQAKMVHRRECSMKPRRLEKLRRLSTYTKNFNMSYKENK